jgi:hypothetical protein
VLKDIYNSKQDMLISLRVSYTRHIETKNMYTIQMPYSSFLQISLETLEELSLFLKIGDIKHANLYKLCKLYIVLYLYIHVNVTKAKVIHENQLPHKLKWLPSSVLEYEQLSPFETSHYK